MTMAISRALVVDDSRSARVALKKLLEEHALEVSTAQSGEEAIEFLTRNKIDVIFMDHTMPGMDGLEAVTAIKANPATATIPVMMYTTREGEVYVGQARALGAVGVLPKNVQPHQLFEMLIKLGLVQERRGSESDSEREREIGQDNLKDVVEEIDRELENQAMGISVQALVTRILEDQHLTLRSDILRSHRTFAKEVAKEISRDRDRTEESNGPVSTGMSSIYKVGVGVVFVAALVFGFLALQFKGQRDTVMHAFAANQSDHAEVLNNELGGLQGNLVATRSSLENVRNQAAQALAWAVNSDNYVDMHEAAFSAGLMEKVSTLVSHLEALGYVGEVEMLSHLGRFCLTVNDVGDYEIAPENLAVARCDYIGHILENSPHTSERLSVPFARFYRANEQQDIHLNLVALNASESVSSVEYPDANGTAGVWNAVARMNNRVEIRIKGTPN